MAQTPNEAVTRHQITTALSVITNPAHFCGDPQHLQAAWQILKQARGQTVDLQRAGPAAYRVEAEPLPRDIYEMSRGCLERLRARAAAKGVPVVKTVWPHGGDAA